MTAEIKILSDTDIDDFSELIDIFEDVFEMKNFIKPGNTHLQKVLATPGFLVLIAKESSKVLGGLTVYTLRQYYSQKPLAYIYDLAVLKDFQQKGIGKALINTSQIIAKRMVSKKYLFRQIELMIMPWIFIVPQTLQMKKTLFIFIIHFSTTKNNRKFGRVCKE